MPNGDRPEDEGLEPELPVAAGAPPDPLDRVWRHPTELPALSSFTAAPAGAGARHRSGTWLVPVVAGAAGALATLAILAITGSFDHTSTPGGSSNAERTTPSVLTTSAPEMATRLGASVLSLSARDARGVRHGSGVCVRHGAEVLTSAHVVGDATSVDVVTADGQHHTASVVGRDRVTDLVLLSLTDASDLPAAPLSERLPATGARVWVLGASGASPSAPWMSAGMVSSSDAVVVTVSGPITAGLLETDAASSSATTGGAAVGGALVDGSGTVAGIVLGRMNGSTTTYAVPILAAELVAEQLHTSGAARHGSLGLDGVDAAAGPMVVKVEPGGPASRAGVRAGDLLRTIDGRAIASIDDATALVRADAPGRIVAIVLRRGRTDLEMMVELGAKVG